LAQLPGASTAQKKTVMAILENASTS